jgi:hypothetical protein
VLNVSRIKWIEDKTENYRGNHTSKLFMVDNSNYVFGFNACMTYKSFKSLVKEFAQKYNSNTVTIINDEGQCNMIICTKFNNDTEKYDFLFRIELPVNEGERRQFKWFEESEIFNTQQTYKAFYADEDVMEVFTANSEDEALQIAYSYESEYGTCFNVFLLDENYDTIETIL